MDVTINCTDISNKRIRQKLSDTDDPMVRLTLRKERGSTRRIRVGFREDNPGSVLLDCPERGGMMSPEDALVLARVLTVAAELAVKPKQGVFDLSQCP